MPIYNMNGGGSNLTYSVKFSAEKPDITSSTKNVLWIKDSLDFLNPYENEQFKKCTLKDIIAYKKDAVENKTGNRIGATFVRDVDYSLHLDVNYGKGSVTYINISNRQKYPYLKIVIPAETGKTVDSDGKTVVDTNATIYFAFSEKAYSEITEGSIIDKEDIYSFTFAYKNSKQTIKIHSKIPQIADLIKDKKYQTLLIFYDKNIQKSNALTTVQGWSNENYTSPTTGVNFLGKGLSTQARGFFVENTIIADVTGKQKSVYFITEKNKSYRVYANDNNSKALFTVTGRDNVSASKPPTEGDTGELIKVDNEKIYFQTEGEQYYLLSGNDFNNICITYEQNTDNVPYIVEGTLTYDLHQLGQNNKSKITDEYEYTGYEINSFEPEILANNSKESLKLWIIDGNNLESNIMITKSNKKRQFLSLEGVVTRLPYSPSMLKPKEEPKPEEDPTPEETDQVTDKATEVYTTDNGNDIIHNELYFLYAELYIAKLEKWIKLKTRSNQFFNLKTLLEGTLTDIYYEENNSIRDYGFFKYSELQSCNFPNCSSVGTSAFYGCTRLMNVNLPVWYKDATPPIFYDGTNTKSVKINSPFTGCTNIISATFGFGGIADGSITTSTSKTDGKITKTGFPLIDASAALETVALPRCTVIGSGTFAYHAQLTDVTLNNVPDDVTFTQIHNQAFYSCSELQNIYNANRISSIGAWAFYGNKKLTSLNLENIKYLGYSAFQGCTELSRISLEGEANNYLKTIRTNAFYGTQIYEINAPNCVVFGSHKTSTNIYSGYNMASTPLNGCSSTITSVTLGLSNVGSTAFPSQIFGGTKTSGTRTPNLVYVSLSNLSNIAAGAFANLKQLEQVTLSPHLHNIPANMFQNCGKITNEVAYMKEFNFPIREFEYEDLVYGYNNGQKSYFSGPPYYIIDKTLETYTYLMKDSKVVCETIPEDGDNHVYEPLLDDEGNPQYIQVKDAEGNDLFVDITDAEGNITQQPYYLLAYDKSKRVKNYDKIIYSVRNPDVADDEESQDEINKEETIEDENATYFKEENGYRVLYGKNKRIIIEVGTDTEEQPDIEEEPSTEEEINYDDWIYRYKIKYSEDGKTIIAPDADTNYIFNECYYKHGIDENGQLDFVKIQSTSDGYAVAQDKTGNVTVYYDKQDNNKTINKIVEGGIEFKNIITSNDCLLYRFKNNKAPTTNYRATIEKHSTNSKLIVSRTDEFGEKITIDYPVTEGSEYYYTFAEKTGETEQKEWEGYLWDFPVFDYTQPIYQEQYTNIRKKLVNKYSEPRILEANYSNDIALSRVVIEGTNKPDTDENFQLVLLAVPNPSGIEFVNKVALNYNDELEIYPGCNILGARGIGAGAFKNCYNLREVYCNCFPDNPNPSASNSKISPSGTYKIGEFAFQNCSNLSIVNMPYCNNFATSLCSMVNKSWIFSKCTQLTSINLSNLKFSTSSTANYIDKQFVSYNSKNDTATPYYSQLSNVKFNAINKISSHAFQNIETLSHAIFNSCVTITQAAFRNTGIGFITQEPLMTVVSAADPDYGNGYYDVWELDKNLNTFIQEGIAYTGYYEIALGNPYLSTVTYYIQKEDGSYEESTGYSPNTEYYLFDGENYINAFIAQDLDNIYEPNKYYQQIDEDTYELVTGEAFNPDIKYFRLTNVIRNINNFSRILQIPNVTSIGAEAFYRCYYLVGGMLNNITTIPQSAFFGCINLTHVTQNTFEEDLPAYEDNVLKPYNYLRIPNVSKISDNAFQGCDNIETITFNSNITTIGNNAFKECKKIYEIHFYPSYKINETEDEEGNIIQTPEAQDITIGKAAFQNAVDNLIVYFHNFQGENNALPKLSEDVTGADATTYIFPDNTRFICDTSDIATYYIDRIQRGEADPIYKTWRRYTNNFSHTIT